MNAPNWLTPRPAFDLPPEKRDAFDALWEKTGKGDRIEYALPYPRWQFLSYLCETKELVLHGSPDPGIEVVEPRQAQDIRAYSNQRAIYATTDGIWVIYFAILDRRTHPGVSLFNSCLRVRLSPDVWSDPLYFFSITHSVLVQRPWCEGMVYILPRRSFTQEPSREFMGVEVKFPHWVSPMPAEPAARLAVGAQDFPFLDKVHGHDNEKLDSLARSDPNGFPWYEAWVS